MKIKFIILGLIAAAYCGASQAYTHYFVNKTSYPVTLFVGYASALCGNIGHRLIYPGETSQENAGACAIDSVQGHWPNKAAHLQQYGNHHWTKERLAQYNGQWWPNAGLDSNKLGSFVGDATYTFTEIINPWTQGKQLILTQTAAKGLGSIIGEGIKDAAITAGTAIKETAELAGQKFLQEVVQPTIQKVIKPTLKFTQATIDKYVMPIAGPIIEKVGKPIFEKVVAPAINFVGEKIVDPLYEKTIKQLYDVKSKLVEIVGKIGSSMGKIAQTMRAGADQLEKAPEQFRTGAKALEALPKQLETGNEEVKKAIKTIHDNKTTIIKQRDAVKAQNLSKVGLKSLNDNLLKAFAALEGALNTLAATNANGTCQGATTGILCNFSSTLLRSKDTVQADINKLHEQINALENTVKGSQAQGNLPTRMRDAASLIELPL